MLMYSYMIILFIFAGLWVFSSKRKHLLSALLSLEFMVLCFYFMFFFFTLYYFLRLWGGFSFIYSSDYKPDAWRGLFENF